MENKRKLNSIEKIEEMFAEDIDLLQSGKSHTKKALERIKIKQLLSIPSFLLKKIYKVLPGVLKDIFFWSSVFHKAPYSKFVAKTKYDEFRTLLDIKASALILKSIPSNTLDQVNNTFNSGHYSYQMRDITELDSLINEVISYATPSHAGARPYFKDGKNSAIEDSFSAYYNFSESHCNAITSFLNETLEEDFRYYLSAIAGYKCELKNISYSLGIVYGENSNSEMHQDTFSSIAKGFIYLQNVDLRGAPFEYLEGSYCDASFRSYQTNLGVVNSDIHSSGSTRLRGDKLEEALRRYHLKTFTGHQGLFILANTAGYHRKGAHNSLSPRITLNFEVKRKGIFSKFLINIFALIKFKLIRAI